jgi:hypothetical protein
MTLIEMEYAIAKYYNWRQNIIVPNISWGLNIHECDLLIVSGLGYCTEIEIKRSKSDLIRDKFKDHCHKNSKIKYFYFAFPENIYEKCKDLVPDNAGIYKISFDSYKYSVIEEKASVINPDHRKLTDQEILQIARLGTMRIWNLKHSLINLLDQIKYQKEEII